MLYTLMQFHSPLSLFQSPFRQFQPPLTLFQSPFRQFQSSLTLFQSSFKQFQSPLSLFQSAFKQFLSPLALFQSPLIEFHPSLLRIRLIILRGCLLTIKTLRLFGGWRRGQRSWSLVFRCAALLW